MPFSLPSTIVQSLPADGPTRSVGWAPNATDRARRAALGASGLVPSAATALLARPATIADGARLDPMFQLGDKVIDIFGDQPLSDETLPGARKKTVAAAYYTSGPHIPVDYVCDLSIPVPTTGAATGTNIGARLYRPTRENTTLPLLVFIHGGGFGAGTLDSHDVTCRYFATRGQVAVLSVDYRLAPEFPYPTPLDDCVAAFRWAREHAEELRIDPERIALAGDSAGGNLTAATCLRLRDAGEVGPAFQMLFVPVTTAEAGGGGTDSFTTFARGPYLTAEHIKYFTGAYLPSDDLIGEPYVSPLLAEDLSGLPSAHVAVAGFDPLRDQGEAYARRMREAGVRVSLRRHETIVHPFVNSVGVNAAARSAVDEAIGAMRMGLGV
ncbi:alpha/beta hydrolase [Dietzia timorensis]|uniref:Carboxylesterase NlhH n=1 Tax=Dietzia timorensis TaxID=499555 RepID=A0A173LMI2_9ACTN|nr:alpha/beta hydrolase [Dietzia timorensis]ANI92884.1 Carboxylesterase NlhH [Dietzia timorensis]